MSVKVGVRASSREQGTFDTAWSSGILPHSHLLQVTFLQAPQLRERRKARCKAHCSDTSLVELCWKGFLLIFDPLLIFIVSKCSFSQDTGIL